MVIQAINYVIGTFGTIAGFVLSIRLSDNLTLGGVFGSIFIFGVVLSLIKTFTGFSEVITPNASVSVSKLSRKKHKTKEKKKGD